MQYSWECIWKICDTICIHNTFTFWCYDEAVFICYTEVLRAVSLYPYSFAHSGFTLQHIYEILSVSGFNQGITPSDSVTPVSCTWNANSRTSQFHKEFK
jgi:hypothetical protein